MLSIGLELVQGDEIVFRHAKELVFPPVELRARGARRVGN